LEDTREDLNIRYDLTDMIFLTAQVFCVEQKGGKLLKCSQKVQSNGFASIENYLMSHPLDIQLPASLDQ